MMSLTSSINVVEVQGYVPDPMGSLMGFESLDSPPEKRSLSVWNMLPIHAPEKETTMRIFLIDALKVRTCLPLTRRPHKAM